MTDGSDTSPAGFARLVRATLPGASDETVAGLRALYPASYADPAQLAWDWITDVNFACTAYHVAGAFADRTRRYVFSVPPAVHGMDAFCKLLVLSFFFFFSSCWMLPDMLTSSRRLKTFITSTKSTRPSRTPRWHSSSRTA